MGTDLAPARPLMPRRPAVPLTSPRDTSNPALFCLFCTRLQKSEAHLLPLQSLPASLQKPRVCRHQRFLVPDAPSQPSHLQTCLPKASKGQPANLPTGSYTSTPPVHIICVQKRSPSPFPSTTSPLYTKTPGCHPERSLISRDEPPALVLFPVIFRTFHHQNEAHPLSFTSLRPLSHYFLAVTTAEGGAAGYADFGAVAGGEQGDFLAALVEAAGGETLGDFGEERREHGGDAAAHNDDVGFEQVDDIAEPDGEETDDILQDLRGDGIAGGAGLADELAADAVEMAAG